MKQYWAGYHPLSLREYALLCQTPGYKKYMQARTRRAALSLMTLVMRRHGVNATDAAAWIRKDLKLG